MKQPTLYLMVGYPGAGKTTVAALIASVTGATHLWADQERVKRFAKPTYSHQENLELYEGLNKVAAKLLKQGTSVVFDTNFNFRRDRDKLRQIARETGADSKLVWVQTPRVIAKTRATEDAHEQHTRLLGNIPEADFERMSDNLEEPEASEQPIVIEGIDVSERTVRTALKLL